REIPAAKMLLRQGMERAQQLRDSKAPWTTATGLVVHGYISKIDGSVQPYGLVVPASYQPGSSYRHRLDLWFHGRGETLCELNFLRDRQRSPGEFTPPDTFVLHPYGRYCNANRFAGGIDTQKQAADQMAAALKRDGIALVHLIGPNTGHAYHPQTKLEISRRIDAIAAVGRDPMPHRVRFTTWTLRYNRMAWLQLDGLDRHWERA